MCDKTKEELAPQWVVFLVGTAFGIGLCMIAAGVWVEQKKRDYEAARLESIEKRLGDVLYRLNMK